MVIGAGFIGCEAAASLAMRGVSVTLVAPDEVPQRKRLGQEAGTRLEALVEKTGVRYLGGVKVASVDAGSVTLDNGDTVGADLVLAATGVRPNSGPAEALGLRLENSRVVVEADMSTGVDGVYAAGDVAMAFNAGAGRALAVEHWQDAADHGEIAGASAAGDDAKWSGVPGFWTTIGDADVKYHAWGDGYDSSRLIDHGDGFTVWYAANGVTVGVLTYQRRRRLRPWRRAHHLRGAAAGRYGLTEPPQQPSLQLPLIRTRPRHMPVGAQKHCGNVEFGTAVDNMLDAVGPARRREPPGLVHE